MARPSAPPTQLPASRNAMSASFAAALVVTCMKDVDDEGKVVPLGCEVVRFALVILTGGGGDGVLLTGGVDTAEETWASEEEDDEDEDEDGVARIGEISVLASSEVDDDEASTGVLDVDVMVVTGVEVAGEAATTVVRGSGDDVEVEVSTSVDAVVGTISVLLAVKDSTSLATTAEIELLVSKSSPGTVTMVLRRVTPGRVFVVMTVSVGVEVAGATLLVGSQDLATVPLS